MVLKWNDLVRVSVISGTSPEQKGTMVCVLWKVCLNAYSLSLSLSLSHTHTDIFKVDSEIGSHANGHAGKKELQVHQYTYYNILM